MNIDEFTAAYTDFDRVIIDAFTNELDVTLLENECEALSLVIGQSLHHWDLYVNAGIVTMPWSPDEAKVIGVVLEKIENAAKKNEGIHLSYEDIRKLVEYILFTADTLLPIVALLDPVFAVFIETDLDNDDLKGEFYD